MALLARFCRLLQRDEITTKPVVLKAMVSFFAAAELAGGLAVDALSGDLLQPDARMRPATAINEIILRIGSFGLDLWI